MNVHKNQVTACCRLGAAGKVTQEVQVFSTMTSGRLTRAPARVPITFRWACTGAHHQRSELRQRGDPVAPLLGDLGAPGAERLANAASASGGLMIEFPARAAGGLLCEPGLAWSLRDLYDDSNVERGRAERRPGSGENALLVGAPPPRQVMRRV
ncbi:MAG TPA: hypothetical protein VNO30_00180 [Kofleriaceae bacterium]|nr:hypothetical protein [Kofleriaceae bacterium]